MRAGIKIDTESVGEGDLVIDGERITIRLQVRLNHGDLVQDLSEYSFVRGKREVIAALEYGVEGMRLGGQRKFHAGSHLCYRASTVTQTDQLSRDAKEKIMIGFEGSADTLLKTQHT
ncbi:FKBP-type peptidyl-prolyl cis-trans isomerase [bacterium]|nr:FKBP-type peptidyl-prolyl cis-trans isomerase [bacterium]